MKDDDQNTQLMDFLNISMHRAMRKLTLMFIRDVLRPEGQTVQEWRSLFYLHKCGSRHVRGPLRSWSSQA